VALLQSTLEVGGLQARVGVHGLGHLCSCFLEKSLASYPDGRPHLPSRRPPEAVPKERKGMT